MKLIKIGTIVNTQGLKGDVRVYPATDYRERFEEMDFLYIEGEKGEFDIEKVRYKKNLVILKFKGYDHINDIEKFKNKDVFIEKLSQEELEKDRYYVEDLIGLDVVDLNKGHLGKLVEIIQNPAHDIYLIELESKKRVMVPAVDQFIKSTDIEKKVITVELIDGFID